MISKKATKRNEAELLDLSKDMMELIAIRFEEFTDDLLPAILGREHSFRIRYSTMGDKLKIEWSWTKYRLERIEELRYQPTAEAEKTFIDRVAAYLYSLLVFITNF